MSSIGIFSIRDGAPCRSRRACERCHSRKVRCDIGVTNGPCSYCTAHGDVCRLRTRRRRKTSAASEPAVPVSGSPSTGISQTLSSGGPVGRSRPTRDTPTPASQQNHRPDVLTSFLGVPDATAGPVSSSLLFTPGVVMPADVSTVLLPDDQWPRDDPRTPSILSRSAILADYPGIDHPNTAGISYGSELSETTVKVLHMYRAFDLPPIPVRQSLIEAFFEKCWTWMPVVELEILHDYPAKPSSTLLQQVIFLAGSQMRRGSSEYASSADYYQRTKALLDVGFEKDVLVTLAALCIIQWWNPAAPTNVSTNTSRFWVTYGIGLAQQLGLHRKTDKPSEQEGLRRRIWWTLYARDCLISSSHGRPRIIHDADCTADPPSAEDFQQPADVRAHIFVFYVRICRVLAKLCELLTRKGTYPSEEKDAIGFELLEWTRDLPADLRFVDGSGSPQPYNFEITQLHVPFLSAVTLLFRPQPVFSISTDNTVAVVAATLNFRIFEAFQLRDHIGYLGPIYSWHILVAAISRLACIRVPSLRDEAQMALNSIEVLLRELGTRWPSALNNLRNLQLLRKGLEAVELRAASLEGAAARDSSLSAPIELFQIFGGEVTKYYVRVEGLLNAERCENTSPSMEGGATSSQRLFVGTEMAPLQPAEVSQGTGSISSALEGGALGSTVGDAMEEPLQQLDDYFAQDHWMRDWVEDLNI